MKKRSKQGKESRQLLRKWLREIGTTINPRSVVEEEAQRFAKEILYEGGLGNPLRGFHPFAAHVRDVVGRAPKGNVYGAEGGMPQLIEAAMWFSKEVDGVTL